MTRTVGSRRRKISVNRQFVPAYLADLAANAAGLAQALHSYQKSLLAARLAGAYWSELAEAMQVSEGSARARHRAAQHGGEMHLRLEGVEK
jgi:hypothetical protein